MKIAMHIEKDLAALAGVDAHGWIVDEVSVYDLDVVDRATLTECTGAGGRSDDYPACDYYLPRAYAHGSWTERNVGDQLPRRSARGIAGVRERLADMRTLRAALEARAANEHEATITAAIAEGATWPLYNDRSGFICDRERLCRDEPRLAEVYAQAREFLAKKSAEKEAARAERERLDKEAAAQKQAAQEARTTAGAELVRSHGTDSQRARLADGLLAQAEIDDLVRTRAFAPIEAPEYAWIAFEDLDHDDACDADSGDGIYCDVAGVTSLDAEHYAALVALRTAVETATPAILDALPRATIAVTLRSHDAYCDCAAPHVVCYGLLVTVAWQGWQVSREYGF